MLAEVAAGLSAPQKELSPKYFYDQRGSELFEEITRLPEYYPTRTERALLEGWMPELMRELGTRTLIELGAGNAEKSRIILDAMRATGPRRAVRADRRERQFLNQTAAQLRREYPGLAVEPAIADIAEELRTCRAGLPHPALYAFLGSTIGNFYPPAAIRLLRRVRAAMESSDRFLMGVDLRKDVTRIEAAYNDSQGVTAEFNRNMLLVLNHELGADFDPARSSIGRSTRRSPTGSRCTSSRRGTRRSRIPGHRPVPFAKGESIRTEISSKYDRESVA